MKLYLRKPVTASLLLGGVFMAGHAQAELTGNAGFTTNYLWRGVTQTNDDPAVQGGLDYSHDSGIYLGGWASNVDFADPQVSDGALPAITSRTEYELDLYGGYAGGVGDFGYDLGFIYYAYPLSDDANFGELALGGSWKWLSAGIAYTVTSEVEGESAFKEDDIYYYAAADIPLAKGLSLGLNVGRYEFDEVDTDYTHYGIKLNKAGFSFGFEQNDLDGDFPAGKDADDPRIVISYTHDFDLL